MDNLTGHPRSDRMDLFWIPQSIVSFILVLAIGFLLLVSIIKLVSLFKAARLSDVPDVIPISSDLVRHNYNHHTGTFSVGPILSAGQGTPRSGSTRDSELGTCPQGRPVTENSVPRSTGARTVSGISRTGAGVASLKVERGQSVQGFQPIARPGTSQGREQVRQPETQTQSHPDIFKTDLFDIHNGGRTPDAFKHFLT